jgi:hypothetical protein
MVVSTDKVQTLMAKRIAKSWLESNSTTEYKLIVYMSGSNANVNLTSLIRTARNKKTSWSKNGPYPDLKVKAGFDFVIVRSQSASAIKEIGEFFQKVGFETFGDFPEFEESGAK